MERIRLSTQSNIQRVQEMEVVMDRVTEALHNAQSLIAFKDDIEKLEHYYETDWLTDYEADERGDLPSDLKRGILSEDALYDLLSEIDERMEQE